MKSSLAAPTGVPAASLVESRPDGGVLPEERSLPVVVTGHIGETLLLLAAMFRALAHPDRWAHRVLAEIHSQMTDAFGLVVFVAMLGGALIAQQTGVQFENNLPAWVVGAIVAATTVTEVTPLFTGIVLSGIVGTRIAAEIGSMRITEQVDALEVMGRDPVAYLVVPRVLGALIATPLLMAFALAASLVAGWGTAVLATRATSADFWFGVRHYMRDFPLFFALIKGFVFGGAVAIIGCYCGLAARGGSEGVGRATRRAVVLSIVGIIVLDVCLVPLLKWVRV